MNMKVGQSSLVAFGLRHEPVGSDASLKVMVGPWKTGDGPYSKSNHIERELGNRVLGTNRPEDVLGPAAQQLELSLRA